MWSLLSSLKRSSCICALTRRWVHAFARTPLYFGISLARCQVHPCALPSNTPSTYLPAKLLLRHLPASLLPLAPCAHCRMLTPKATPPPPNPLPLDGVLSSTSPKATAHNELPRSKSIAVQWTCLWCIVASSHLPISPTTCPRQLVCARCVFLCSNQTKLLDVVSMADNALRRVHTAMADHMDLDPTMLPFLPGREPRAASKGKGKGKDKGKDKGAENTKVSPRGPPLSAR